MRSGFPSGKPRRAPGQIPLHVIRVVRTVG
jgi:hypothetical protein